MRLDADGTRDSTLDGDGVVTHTLSVGWEVRAVVVAPDHRIIGVNGFGSGPNIVVLKPHGSLDTGIQLRRRGRRTALERAREGAAPARQRQGRRGRHGWGGRDRHAVPGSVGTSTTQKVREGGFEPPRPLGHWDLNPARLPVPPLPRDSSLPVDHRGFLPIMESMSRRLLPIVAVLAVLAAACSHAEPPPLPVAAAAPVVRGAEPNADRARHP